MTGEVARPVAGRRLAWRASQELAGAALDLLLPPRCLACGAIVGRDGGLCAACWAGIAFLEGACCQRCGRSFTEAVPEGTLCGGCLRRPATAEGYDRARAACRYDAASRGLILALKHRDQTHFAPTLAQWLARAGAHILPATETIAPVPLHWSRLFARRYNQAALLARALGRLSGVRVAPDLLIRRRATRSQGGLGALARHENVRGAFALNPRHAAHAQGRRLLLVDDVLTTGATLDACAVALKRAGAVSVDALTLARVDRSPGFLTAASGLVL